MTSKTSHWDRVPLVSVAKCQGGAAFSPSLQGKRRGDVPFFKVSDMNLPGNSWCMRGANNYVDRDDFGNILGSPKPSGSVIFPKVGAAVHTNKKRVLITPSFVDNNIMAVWPHDPNRCRSSYLYLYFRTVDLSLLSNPGPLPSINASRVYSQDIPLPPVEEQDQIVKVMTAVHNVAERTTRMLSLTRELKDALAERLFTRGIAGGGSKDSPTGKLPESWSSEPLGDHTLQSQYGLSIRGAETGRIPILRMNCQENGAVVFRDLQYVDIDDSTFRSFRLAPGDLLFNRTNSFDLVGRTAVYRSDRDAVFASYLVRVTLDEAVWVPEFINYYLNRPAIQRELKKLASRGVSQANINATKLRGFHAPVTTRREQEAIVARLSAVDRSIAALEARRNALRELFEALLSRIMSGELSTRDLQAEAEELTIA